MNRSDRVRRAVSLTLAVLCFLVVPQLAFGQFSSSKAPAMSVGTVQLVTPTAVDGTYRCTYSFLWQSADVRVNGFTVADQPGGVSYVYTLYRNGVQRDTETTTATGVSLDAGTQRVSSSTTYRVSIVTKLGNWTADEYSRTFTCGFFSSSGSL